MAVIVSGTLYNMLQSISVDGAGRDSVSGTPCNTPISVDMTVSVNLQYISIIYHGMDKTVSVILRYILVIYYSVDFTVQSSPAKHLNNLSQRGHKGFSHPAIHLSNLLQRGHYCSVISCETSQ